MVLLFAVVFGVGLFAKSMKSKLSMSMALVFCMIAIFMLKVSSFAINVLQVKILHPEAVGQLYLASRYSIFAWNILWPIIVVTMMFILWRSKPQRVR